MLLQWWRFITLFLTALALTMTSAHVLEMPVKLHYPPDLYSSVNTTLYRYFAIIGAAYTLGSLLAAIVLAIAVRRRRASRRWAAAGALALTLAFGSWLGLVQPVNAVIASALQTAPETVPGLWRGLRFRWEYGHAVGFLLQLLGFAALLFSVLAEIPRHHERRSTS